VDLYGQVLLELLTAMGAALFVANAYALVRRGADRRAAARAAVMMERPGSPVRRTVRQATTGRLDQVPIGRSLAFMVLGLVVAVWGLASLT
jgi:hypothetical protein